MTIEEIKVLLQKDRAHENDHIDCNCDMEEIWRVEGFEELADACEQLLKERDEALQALAEKEREKEAMLKLALDRWGDVLARAEAYREIAINIYETPEWESPFTIDSSKTDGTASSMIDAEAAAILERRKGEVL